LFPLSGCEFLGYEITPVKHDSQNADSHRSILKRQIPLTIDKKSYIPDDNGIATINGKTAPNSKIDYKYGENVNRMVQVKSNNDGKFKLQVEAMTKNHKIIIIARNKNYNSSKISANIMGQLSLMPYNDFYTAYKTSDSTSAIPISLKPPLSGDLKADVNPTLKKMSGIQDTYITFSGNIDPTNKELIAIYLELQKHNKPGVADPDLHTFASTVYNVGEAFGFPNDQLNTVTDFNSMKEGKTITLHSSEVVPVIMQIKNTSTSIKITVKPG
jgi:hypothetical protein